VYLRDQGRRKGGGRYASGRGKAKVVRLGKALRIRPSAGFKFGEGRQPANFTRARVKKIPSGGTDLGHGRESGMACREEGKRGVRV